MHSGQGTNPITHMLTRESQIIRLSAASVRCMAIASDNQGIALGANGGGSLRLENMGPPGCARTRSVRMRVGGRHGDREQVGLRMQPASSLTTESGQSSPKTSVFASTIAEACSI